MGRVLTETDLKPENVPVQRINSEGCMSVHCSLGNLSPLRRTSESLCNCCSPKPSRPSPKSSIVRKPNQDNGDGPVMAFPSAVLGLVEKNTAGACIIPSEACPKAQSSKMPITILD